MNDEKVMNEEKMMNDEKVHELAREYVNMDARRANLVREVEALDQEIRRVENELVGSFDWNDAGDEVKRILVQGVSGECSVMLNVRDCTSNKVTIKQPDVFVPAE